MRIRVLLLFCFFSLIAVWSNLSFADVNYILDGDMLGSINAMVDHSGVITAVFDYDSFGDVFEGNFSQSSMIAYRKEIYDKDTGLIYLRTRQYDPITGRFISKDPFGGYANRPQSINYFPYCNNNPINYVDPSGEVAVIDNVIGAGLGGIFGAVYGGLLAWSETKDANIMWKAAKVGAATGTVTGGVAGVLAAAPPVALMVGAAVSGAVTNVIGITISQGVDNTTVSQAIGATAEGSFAGFLAAGGVLAAGAKATLGEQITAVVGVSMFSGAAWSGGRAVTEVINYFSDLNEITLGDIGRSIANAAGAFSSKFSSWFSGNGPAAATNNYSFGDMSLISAYGYGGYSSGFLSFADFGGVSLSTTATLMNNITDLSGAVFDPFTGQIVLYGKENVALPAMSLDDLAVAVRSVYGIGGDQMDPGVSIDPPVINGDYQVRYDGQTNSFAVENRKSRIENRVSKIIESKLCDVSGGIENLRMIEFLPLALF